MAGASSDISEEMIELSFLECFQITIFLRYSFATTSSVFCFLFFFFQSVVQNGGAHYTRACIIHGRALYTGVHYTRVNMVFISGTCHYSHRIEGIFFSLLEMLCF